MSHKAVQYATAMGLRVIAIDTGSDKRDLCLALGAETWIDFKDSENVIADVLSATKGGAHAAIIISGSGAEYTQAAMYVRPRGYLMVVGLPKDALLSIPVSLVCGRVGALLPIMLSSSKFCTGLNNPGNICSVRISISNSLSRVQ